MEFAFLMCSERSGSNLVTRMMDRHPVYCGPSPIHAFRILGDALPAYGNLDDAAAWARLTDDCAALIQAQIGVWRTQWSDARLLAEVSERSLAAVLRHVYATEAAAHGKTRVLVKEIGVHRFLPYLLAAFPGSRYVHVVRDPRDMALSWKRSPTHRGGVVRAAAVWREEQAAALRILAWLGEVGLIHSIRYEELLRRPEETLRGLCRFLHVGFDAAMLDFHRDDLTRGNAGRTDNWRNLSSPLLRDNAGKFRDGLSEDETRYVETACRAEMPAFGYAPETEPATDPAALEARLAGSEPVHKPLYDALPDDERHRRAQWRTVVARIRRRGADVTLGGRP